jgi:uncharacterized protein involved in exopolysaccharide biosynthesis
VITKLLLRWWWLVAISVALGAGVGWFVRSRQPEIYFTRASLWFGSDITGLAQSGGSLNQLDDLIAIYSAYIRRDTVLQPVIDRLGLNITVADLNDRMAINDASDLPILEIVVGDQSGGRKSPTRLPTKLWKRVRSMRLRPKTNSSASSCANFSSRSKG